MQRTMSLALDGREDDVGDEENVGSAMWDSLP
jgi:hypothetical protein